MKRKSKFKELELVKNFQYYSMMIPAVAVFFIFAYMSFPGIMLAFQRYTNGGLFHNEWVGFDNFKAFFTGPYFWKTTRNTFIINISNLVAGTFFGVFSAILMNELFSARLKKIFQNILFLPTFFSVLLVAKLAALVFDKHGILNVLIEAMGGAPQDFYGMPNIWVPILIALYIWKGLGYNIIVYLATLSGFDSEIYEAAQIDGAGRVKQLQYITLPLLVSTIIILTLRSIGRIFYGDFQLIYAIIGTSNTVLFERLDIIETYIFRTVNQGGSIPDYGSVGAISLYQTLLGFVMIFISNTVIKRYNKDYALF